MKTTHDATCECCERAGLPARVKIEVEGDQVSAVCESHGPWLIFRAESYAQIIAAHNAKVAEIEAAESIPVSMQWGGSCASGMMQRGWIEQRAKELRLGVDPSSVPRNESIAPAPAPMTTFQDGVAPWMAACFGSTISADTVERNHRFLEESLELVQACGCSREDAHTLVDYVFGRNVGEKRQEVGGVMVTLAALCLANGVDMHEAGDAELTRVWQKIDQIREKQLTKPKGSPLPAERSVADIADRELVRRAVVSAGYGRKSGYRWARVSDTFALGSTYASQLCRRFDMDPDAKVGSTEEAHVDG
jgi:hypothetical protein